MGLTTEMKLPSATREEGHHFTYVGRFRYAITLTVRGQKPLFADAGAVRSVLEKLSDSSLANHFEVIAYCFLRDRLMLVVGGKEESSDLRAFLREFRSACVLPGGEGSGIRMWSRRYLERVVRRGEDLHRVVRDLFRAPVSAGLARFPADYPFQGSFAGFRPEPTSPRGKFPRKTGSRSPAARRPAGGGRRGSPRPGR